MSRRRLLGMTGLSISASSAAVERKPLLVRAYDSSGSPAAGNLLNSLLLTDRDGRPFELVPRCDAAGAARIEVPDQKFELMMLMPVRGFGQNVLYADNGGEFYLPSAVQDRELLLNYEFARSRSAFVRRYVAKGRAEGVNFSPAVTQRLGRGEAALAQASQARDFAARAGHSNDSLAETMWAGETAALERARYHIGRNGVRPGFLFGCAAFGFARSEDYAQKFASVFNFATLPFYRNGIERVEGNPDYSVVTAILEKMAGTQVLPKGHPLVYFNNSGIPRFVENRPWDELKRSFRDYVVRTVTRFRTRIHVWDVINEAHDWANDLNLNVEQLLEMTSMACESARAADPTAFRIVNSCCTWGEYVATRRAYSASRRPPLQRPAMTPLDYVRAMKNAGLSYDAIGLQVYYPARDMLETERQLERFFGFGKPIHITELGVPSSSGPLQRKRNPTPSRNVWHGTEWSERIQADWLEQFYTICYSKPQIQAVSWWSFTDPASNPHAGLLHSDLRPKQAYERLARLLQSWKGSEPALNASSSAVSGAAAAPAMSEESCACLR